MNKIIRFCRAFGLSFIDFILVVFIM